VLYKHKIFLFIQTNRFVLRAVANALFMLNLSSNYMQVSTSLAKLLFKLESSFGFFFRELLLVFFDDHLLIHHLLANDKLLSSTALLCYNSFFINVKFLNIAGKLPSLFLSNFSCLKTNFNAAVYHALNYVTNLVNLLKRL
jgi:hypothetical protein